MSEQTQNENQPDPSEPISEPNDEVLAQSAAETETAGEQDQTSSEPESKAEYASQINPDIQLELDRFGRHVDVLTEAVLESADLANRSAMTATTVSENLRKSMKEWSELNGKNIFYLKILVAVGGIVMFLSTVLFTVSAMRVGARTAELDAMLLAVGKRVVELNAATQSVESLNRSVQLFNAKQEALASAQTRFEATIQQALSAAQEAVGKVPQEAAKQVGASNGALVKEIGSLKATVDAQRAAVGSLDRRLNGLSGKINDVEKLRNEVNAMVTLQRERYLEALQRAAVDNAKPPPKPLSYPRAEPEGAK